MVPRGIKPKAYRQLLQQAEAAGCDVRIGKGNHIRISTPKGLVFCSYTTGSRRTVDNVRAELRRRGVDL